jgi:hypothetical protein
MVGRWHYFAADDRAVGALDPVLPGTSFYGLRGRGGARAPICAAAVP